LQETTTDIASRSKRPLCQHDPARLLRLMVLVASISILVILGVGSFVIHQVYSSHVTDIAEKNAVQVSEALVRMQHGKLFHFTDNGEEQLLIDHADFDQLNQELRSFLKTFEILKIKIYTPEWLIIYSTDPSLIGRVDYGNNRLNRSLTGVSDSQLVRKGQVSDLYDEALFDVDVVETYVPIFNNEGQVVGCFEIYRDVTSYRAEVYSGVVSSVGILALILLVVFGCSYLVLRKGTRQLDLALKHLSLLATTDSLCLVWNRKTILDRFKEEVARLDRTCPTALGRELSLVLIDIDRFRSLNETYGAHSGDRVLKQLGALLKSEMREYDAVGRFGGGQFLVLLPDTGRQQAMVVADRLRQRVGEKAFEIGGVTIELTVTVGVSSSGQGSMQTAELLHSVQSALHQAKRKGRNQVVWLPASESSKATRHVV